jgi:hypothetical protein
MRSASLKDWPASQKHSRNNVPELNLILLLIALSLALRDWLWQWREDRRVTLRISAVSYQPKPKHIMLTNLRSTIGLFAQLLLVPVNAFGTKVKLDEDAIIAEVVSGEGAQATVQVINDDNGDRRFLVNFIPGETPGESRFRLRGDAAPGEAVEILEEEFIYTTTPENAVSLGVQVNYLPKTSLPSVAAAN